MPTHAEQRILPYTPEQLFDLVVDVERYPEFLPWCSASRITKGEGDVFYADLMIGYKMIQETYGSKVTALRPDHIHVEYLSGPMRHLSNHWRFIEQEEGGCLIDFYVDLELRNTVFQHLLNTFFNEAIKKMVQAFEKRAGVLYGNP